MRAAWLLLALAVAGCGSTGKPVTIPPGGAVRPPSATPNLPDFAARPYEPFSRSAAVAIALREWRAWGQGVDDDPPGTRPPPLPEDKAERQQGFWQRVGEYWFLGEDPSRLESAWTGKHDAYGQPFAATDDGDYAWSAAFICYVMRTAGAGAGFLYSPAHHDYIDTARLVSLGQITGPWRMSAEAPDAYAPQLGDLICLPRTRRKLTFADLPAGTYPAHCDIVVGTAPGSLSVVGGNVDDAVTMKHVPVTVDGKLSPPGGPPVDDRYPWFAVIRMLYDTA